MKNRLYILSGLLIGGYVIYRLISGAPYIIKAYNEVISMTINRPDNYDDLRLSELWGEYYVNIYHIRKLVPEDSIVYFPDGYLDVQVDGAAALYFLYPRQVKEYTQPDIEKLLSNDKEDYLFIYNSQYTLQYKKGYLFPDNVDTNPEEINSIDNTPIKGLLII